MCGTPRNGTKGMPINVDPNAGPRNKDRDQKQLDEAYKAQQKGRGFMLGESVPWAITSEGRKANQGGGQGALAGGGANASYLGEAVARPMAAPRRRTPGSGGGLSTPALMGAGTNTLLGG